jgi:hypothetical protein
MSLLPQVGMHWVYTILHNFYSDFTYPGGDAPLLHGFQDDFTSPSGDALILHDFTWFYMILHDFTWFYIMFRMILHPQVAMHYLYMILYDFQDDFTSPGGGCTDSTWLHDFFHVISFLLMIRLVGQLWQQTINMYLRPHEWFYFIYLQDAVAAKRAVWQLQPHVARTLSKWFQYWQSLQLYENRSYVYIDRIELQSYDEDINRIIIIKKSVQLWIHS